MSYQSQSQSQSSPSPSPSPSISPASSQFSANIANEFPSPFSSSFISPPATRTPLISLSPNTVLPVLSVLFTTSVIVFILSLVLPLFSFSIGIPFSFPSFSSSSTSSAFEAPTYSFIDILSSLYHQSNYSAMAILIVFIIIVPSLKFLFLSFELYFIYHKSSSTSPLSLSFSSLSSLSSNISPYLFRRLHSLFFHFSRFTFLDVFTISILASLVGLNDAFHVSNNNNFGGGGGPSGGMRLQEGFVLMVIHSLLSLMTFECIPYEMLADISSSTLSHHHQHGDYNPSSSSSSSSKLTSPVTFDEKSPLVSPSVSTTSDYLSVVPSVMSDSSSGMSNLSGMSESGSGSGSESDGEYSDSEAVRRETKNILRRVDSVQ